MEEYMKVNIKTTRNMDSEFIHGQIKDSIKVYGVKESSMLLESIMFLEVKESMDYGKMEKG